MRCGRYRCTLRTGSGRPSPLRTRSYGRPWGRGVISTVTIKTTPLEHTNATGDALRLWAPMVVNMWRDVHCVLHRAGRGTPCGAKGHRVSVAHIEYQLESLGLLDHNGCLYVLWGRVDSKDTHESLSALPTCAVVDLLRERDHLALEGVGRAFYRS